MVINRNNYEEYIVDYADGNLSAELKAEMERFLKANSDIQEELEMFLEAPIIDKSITFSGKDSLKKIPFAKTEASSDYFQNQCVAYIEGLMPENEIDFFLDLIAKDEHKQKELQLFQKSLLPKEDHIFNEKILLKINESNHKITNENFEEYCVACVEGWLNQSGLVALNIFIAEDIDRQKTLSLYQKTKLSPDLLVVYHDKRKLRKYSLIALRSRKIFSYAASAAAVLVFSVMAFYTAKLDNPTELASHVSETKTIIQPVEEIIEPKVVIEEKNSKTKEILHDPFGFEKVSSPIRIQTAETRETKQETMDKIRPIQVSELNCEPCKAFFESDPELVSIGHKKIVVAPTPEVSRANNVNNAANNNIAWNVAQAGITGFNKFTNAKIKVEPKQEKTKIEFKSKYFAFSTNVKKRNN